MKTLFTLLANVFPFLRELYEALKKAQEQARVDAIIKKNKAKLERLRKDLADRVDASSGADRP